VDCSASLLRAASAEYGRVAVWAATYGRVRHNAALPLRLSLAWRRRDERNQVLEEEEMDEMEEEEGEEQEEADEADEDESLSVWLAGWLAASGPLASIRLTDDSHYAALPDDSPHRSVTTATAYQQHSQPP